MSTLNISLPEDLKRRFAEAFAGQDKSAVVARLMEEAIERAERDRQSRRAVQRILNRRAKAPQLAPEDFARLRSELRRKWSGW